MLYETEYLVVNQETDINRLQAGVGGEDGIVGLHYGRGHLVHDDDDDDDAHLVEHLVALPGVLGRWRTPAWTSCRTRQTACP